MGTFVDVSVDCNKYIFLGYLEAICKNLEIEGFEDAGEFGRTIEASDTDFIRMKSITSDDGDYEYRKDLVVFAKLKLNAKDEDKRKLIVSEVINLIDGATGATGGPAPGSETYTDLIYFKDKLGFAGDDLAKIVFYAESAKTEEAEEETEEAEEE